MSHAPALPGTSGQAVRFDGVNDTISLSPETATAINALRNDLSVAAWINPAALSGDQPIAAVGRASTSDDGFAFGLENGDLYFDTFGVHEYVLSDPGLQAGHWTHVAAVLDEQNDVTFYVDGVAQGTFSHDRPVNPDAADRLFIGANGAGATFDGLLDELIVVGRALGADEVRELAQQRTVGVTAVDAAFRPVLPGSPFHNPSQPDALALYLPLDDTSNANSVDNVYFTDLAEGDAAVAVRAAPAPILTRRGGWATPSVSTAKKIPSP